MGMIRDAIEAKGLTINAVSRICDVSELLIRMLDAGHVTHPRIAHRIARALDLTQEQEESLKPEEHRCKPVTEPVKSPVPLTRPVGSKPKRRTMDYGMKSNVFINSDKIWEIMHQRRKSAEAISLETNHCRAWMSSRLQAGKMRRKDVGSVARILGVDIMDIIGKP